jgi:hypothetical protein
MSKFFLQRVYPPLRPFPFSFPAVFSVACPYIFALSFLQRLVKNAPPINWLSNEQYYSDENAQETLLPKRPRKKLRRKITNPVPPFLS